MNRTKALQVVPRSMLLLSVLLTGCATVYEGRYPSAEGWRHGWVRTTGSAKDVSDATLQKGDTVYVNVKSCEVALTAK